LRWQEQMRAFFNDTQQTERQHGQCIGKLGGHLLLICPSGKARKARGSLVYETSLSLQPISPKMSNLSKTTMPAPTGSYRPFGLTLRRVFVGEQGIRAGWSVLIFAAIFWILQTVVLAALGHFMALDPPGPIPVRLGFLQESCQVLVVAAATLVMARIEKRSFLSYGYIDQHKLVRLATGVFLGFFCISALVGALWKAGLLVFDGMLLSGLTAWKYALAWGLVFLLVGIFEESLLRGYAQFTLARGIGFWWAALLLSTLFGLGHAGNGGESVLGVIEVCTAGLIFCLSLWYTKSLWWAIGFHAGWD
jgi:CAAX protease family protein